MAKDYVIGIASNALYCIQSDAHVDQLIRHLESCGLVHPVFPSKYLASPLALLVAKLSIEQPCNPSFSIVSAPRQAFDSFVGLDARGKSKEA